MNKLEQKAKKALEIHEIGMVENSCIYAYECDLTEEDMKIIDDIHFCNFEDYESDEYFNCETEIVELQEGIFNFNFEDYEFEVIKWYIDDNTVKEHIVNKVNKLMKSLAEERFLDDIQYGKIIL